MSSDSTQSARPDSDQRQRDDLLDLLLHKIPTSKDRHQLEEATVAALQLILRRTGDEDLIAALKCQIDMAIFGVGEEGAPVDGQHQLGQAALRCFNILEKGRRERKPRDAVHTPPSPPLAAPAEHHHHDAKAKRATGWKRGVGLALVAVAAATGTWLFLQESNPRHTAAELVRQMDDAAHGNGPSTHVFGGTLTLTKDGNTLSVVADRVPADICVSASWLLIRKGVVAIDDTTPQRVTPAQLSDLCHEREMGATLTWSPKTAERNEPPPPDDPRQTKKGE